MADVTDGCTLVAKTISGGFGMAVVKTAATADDGDYFTMDDLIGFDVNVIFATGIQDPTGTGASEPMEWTGSTTTPDKVTIGGSTDNKRRDVLVVFTSRESTGGDSDLG